MGLSGAKRPESGVDDGAETDREARARQVAAAFTELHGMPPAGVWWTPATVPLLGDHFGATDTPILSAALPWGAAVAFSPTDDAAVRVHAVRPAALLGRRAPRRMRAWERPVAAVLTARADTPTGARVLLDVDPFDPAPHLTAACAALLAAAECDSGGQADRAEMARLARRALAAHAPADTAACAVEAVLRAAPDRVLLTDRHTGRGRPLPFASRTTGLRLLVVDTGAPPNRRTAARRRTECARAAAELGVSSLREVTDLDGALAALDGPVARRRVQHAVTETHRLNALVGLLRAGSAGDVGPILNSAHLSLRDAFAAVPPKLDVAADTAVRRGARGARATGSGRRVLALVPEERVAAVGAAVRAAFAERRWSAPLLGIADPAPGAHRLR